MLLSKHVSLSFLLLLLLPSPVLCFNPEVPLLLSFKYSILSDPLNVLSNWGYFDSSPCSWNGVICTSFPLSNLTTQYSDNTNNVTNFNSSDMWVPTASRVISLILPNSQLLGPISPELGLLTHLRHLDLSNNLFNGTLPSTLFNASELQVLSLSNNELSGQINESIGRLNNLKVLNLAKNAFTGNIPRSVRLLMNLTDLSLSNNYLHGELPSGGFNNSIETIDLSSNLLNGTIPLDFGGMSLKYLNLSGNHLTGSIPSEIKITPNATVDFSFNNLSGPIPQTRAFLNQNETAFFGNTDLCGTPLENLCTIPSSISNPPNPKQSKSPPAFAAIPKNTSVDSPVNSSNKQVKQGGLRVRVFTIVAIVAGDLVGIAILAIVFMYVYHVKKKKNQQVKQRERKTEEDLGKIGDKNKKMSLCCLKKKKNETEDSSECSTCSETEEDNTPKKMKTEKIMKNISKMEKNQNPIMVTLDGPELELETLLKASAYILGAAGKSIVYKAILGDGTALVVRRIGENLSGNGVEKLKDFEIHVKSIAKFKHLNLLRIRGFYWGPEEKLLICDYASNGSLSSISLRRKQSSSPLNLNWDTRIRIIKGVARGLSYLHEKKQIHGNIKPSNILLNFEFEPLIADFGLDKLIKPDPLTKPFGSKRSAMSLPDLSPPPGASPFTGTSSLSGPTCPYLAPESLKNIKQSTKWDVYSFGIIILELLTGRVFTEVEICQWNSKEDVDRVLKMVDPYLRGEIRGKEEAVLSWFKLGLDCCAMLPQKRPNMKDVMQVLDRLPYSS